jgi:hypothetical protein
VHWRASCTVLVSDTAPVREVIRYEENELFPDFFNAKGLATQACRVLKDPTAYRSLCTAGRALVEECYSLEKNIPGDLESIHACHEPRRQRRLSWLRRHRRTFFTHKEVVASAVPC